MIYISTSSPDRQTDILVEQYRAVYNCMLTRGKKVDSTISLRIKKSRRTLRSHIITAAAICIMFLITVTLTKLSTAV